MVTGFLRILCLINPLYWIFIISFPFPGSKFILCLVKNDYKFVLFSISCFCESIHAWQFNIGLLYNFIPGLWEVDFLRITGSTKRDRPPWLFQNDRCWGLTSWLRSLMTIGYDKLTISENAYNDFFPRIKHIPYSLITRNSLNCFQFLLCHFSLVRMGKSFDDPSE